MGGEYLNPKGVVFGGWPKLALIGVGEFPRKLLSELRARGYVLQLKDSTADFGAGGRSKPQISIQGPKKLDAKTQERIEAELPRLKLALLLEEPPAWLIDEMYLCMDPASPVCLHHLAATVAYHVGGIGGWAEVVEEIADALLAREPEYLRSRESVAI